MIDEGYIKYRCYWSQVPAIAETEIAELNQWRTKFYQLGLIGEYDSGIGFGNISIRLDRFSQLIISGTQTGGIANLTAQHYTKVVDFDWQENYVVCEGLIKASSETLTHAAIYAANPSVNAVVHVHHRQLWQKLLDRVPTTNPNCAYGTPEMAEEIIRLCQQPSTQQQKIIVMSGHEEGILTFGKSLGEASNVLLQYFAAL
ncbi:class II aldolase/adducin family protein [Pleurocapsales cyanobacterium LEGE 10410]|nr:class II aldolase/adducin family protein [Pleurocapsales cyanobacterium LEGE 10410]